jgi:arsenite/tail-anchored protein-transporting ATPase
MADALVDLVRESVRFYFFTGKGGVGKTSLACATAVGLADRGRRTLLVSTDPASNLDAVLGVALGNTPAPVSGAPNLMAMNIDPDAAARAYRERTIAPYRETVPDAELAQIEEQLAGACTVEVAAFDEFTVLLGQDTLMQSLEHVVFDTAPTGHTLRLLQLPAAWSRFLDTSATAVSCLGPLAGLKAQQARYEEAVATLGDARATALVLVARPDRVALLEAERTRTELGALGMQNQVLVVNALFRATDRHDLLALAVEERANRALAAMPVGLRALRRIDVPMRGFNIVGVPLVRAFLSEPGEEPRGPEPSAQSIELPPIPSLASIIEELAVRDHGLVMVMGKGGVGKTTIAAAIAVALADRGRPVLLTTTDPAAHVTETLAVSIPGLSVSRIDPVAEARRYREETYASKAPGLDAEHRALLHEELQSPCYSKPESQVCMQSATSSVHRGWPTRRCMRGSSVLNTSLEWRPLLSTPTRFQRASIPGLRLPASASPSGTLVRRVTRCESAVFRTPVTARRWRLATQRVW